MHTVAFYSYKGGVGRTLLLANTARFLALAGKKVVALDLDLEAPGLHYKLGAPEVLARARDGALHGAVDQLLAVLSDAGGRSIADFAVAGGSPVEINATADGGVWLGDIFDALKFDSAGQLTQQIFEFPSFDAQPDPSGNLWIAAYFNGVAKYGSAGDFQFRRLPANGNALGLAVVGGLIVSQLLTLYTTPVIYLYLDRLGRWLGSSKRQAPKKPRPVLTVVGAEPAEARRP
jgi:hypothetical protein